jgi:anti-sigma B factor antagonist
MNNDIVPGFDDDKDDSVKLRLQNIDGMKEGLIIYASGYIDSYNYMTFQKRVDKAIETGFVRLLFEMSQVNYISSTGIGSFVYFLKTVRPRNGDLVLDYVQPKVFEVFQLLGLSQFLTFKKDSNESIALLRNHVQSALFPRLFPCPICSKKLKASKAGRFRCVECKTILLIDQTTKVFLG